MKIALVHDFLLEYGGAERVLEALHEIWPKAPVYTAFYDPKALGINAAKFKGWNIVTSWGTKLPFWRQLVSPWRIFSKSFFESFDLSKFDLVISSSNAYMAKAVRVPNGVHVCYCHTPPRFLYGYPTALEWRKNPILRPIGEVINHIMRIWDFEVAQTPKRTSQSGSTVTALYNKITANGRVDFFIANSKEVQARIKKFYRRDSKVIYPPVDVSRFARKSTNAKRLKTKAAALDISPSSLDNYFLTVSRLVASKNVDIIVEVCAKLGLPLKVVGTGRELDKLKSIASRLTINEKQSLQSSSANWRTARLERSTIDFIGDVDDEQLIELYQNCRAVIFAASQEDFGLVPVEAMAAGKPVITLAEGGVLESIIDAIPAGKGKGTGVYFDPSTTGSLTLAINNFTYLEKKGYFDAQFISRHAQKFSKERFRREILKFVESKMK